ncbi:MAG: tetratricopeptide repeat protein [Fimbriimonas ginsengisoli]|nr:tetratricopeptide repeat protein [Fimbriimonas ginsengisoli]
MPDNTLIKRWYAPWLVTQGDLDRAMDFYEDVLDANPADVDVLLEYAQALEKAGRDFEVPAVLQNVLAANPDSNVRAQALAWKIELEEPKRVETMESARLKMERREFDKALQELRPLRNWLADYWKLWALLASGNNVIGNYPEAEDAAKRVIQLFPACEPAYAELATALGAQNRLEEAYSILRRAAAILPSSLPIFLNLALAAKRSGREDEARGIAKQIREGAGTDPEVAKALEEIEA